MREDGVDVYQQSVPLRGFTHAFSAFAVEGDRNLCMTFVCGRPVQTECRLTQPPLAKFLPRQRSEVHALLSGVQAAPRRGHGWGGDDFEELSGRLGCHSSQPGGVRYTQTNTEQFLVPTAWVGGRIRSADGLHLRADGLYVGDVRADRR